MRESRAVLRRVPLESLASIDPESLPVSTSPRFAFKYIDISSAAAGKLSIPSASIEFSDAPSRARKVLRSGDVIMSTVRPNLKAFAYCDFDTGAFVASTGFAVLRAREVAAPYFLLCALLSDDVTHQIDRFAVGSNYPAINSSDVRRLLVPEFSVAKQRRIAAILTGLDAAIEKTEALIEKHEQIKAGLMHDLLSRGVLPDGQLRPLREHMPSLYHETEIGWIPRDWKLASARQLCSLITKGTTPARHEMWEGADGVRFLRVDNLTFDGQLDFTASSFRIATSTHVSMLARSRCVPDDVLMNIVGPPLGKVGLVPAGVGEVNINQAIAVFRPTAQLSSPFLLRWLISDFAKRWFRQRAKQTSGQLNITLAMCQGLPTPLIELSEQHAIAARASGVEGLIQSESDRLAKLTYMKLGLMQDLLTGKVPVKIEALATEPADA